MNQMNLLYKKSDPETSKLAANGARSLIKHHEKLIIDCLETYRTGSAEQIADRINLDSIKVARRMANLVRSGLVMDSGRRAMTRSNRQCIIWEIL